MNVSTLNEEIGLVARRVRRFAGSIAQGHEFGIEPGWADDLTADDFQDVAVGVYTETLPWEYLVGLSRSFADRAKMIEDQLADDDDAAVVVSYLRAVANAVERAAPDHVLHTPPLRRMEDTTPPVMPFHRLAGLVSVAGARRLHDAAARVEAALAGADTCPLTDEELAWLRRLKAGDRVLDIARDHGLAERTLYRALSGVWVKLGVTNRIDGISRAVASGWLEG